MARRKGSKNPGQALGPNPGPVKSNNRVWLCRSERDPSLAAPFSRGRPGKRRPCCGGLTIDNLPPSGETSASRPVVGSEEAPNEELASVRRTNRTYSFPVSGFHERAFAICSEGMSETRLTSLNSVRNRLVGYSFHAALRHRLVRCDHSRRIIQPSS